MAEPTTADHQAETDVGSPEPSAEVQDLEQMDTHDVLDESKDNPLVCCDDALFLLQEKDAAAGENAPQAMVVMHKTELGSTSPATEEDGEALTAEPSSSSSMESKDPAADGDEEEIDLEQAKGEYQGGNDVQLVSPMAQKNEAPPENTNNDPSPVDEASLSLVPTDPADNVSEEDKDEESNALPQESSPSPGDEETGNAPRTVNANNDAATNSDLIKAELVEQAPMAEGELLDENDTPEKRRRRRLIRFIILALVLAAIIIAIVVSVVNNNGSGGGGTIVTVAPTTPQPTAPPTTPQPTPAPTLTPTQLVWGLVESDNRIDGNSPDEISDFTLVRGGNFGSHVAMADIRDTTIGDQTNQTTLLAISFRSPQEFQGPAGIAGRARDLFLYFCTLDAGCESGAFFEKGIFGASALSGNGAWLAMDSGAGISLFHLPDMDFVTKAPTPPIQLSDTSFNILALAMDRHGKYLAELTSDGIFLYHLGEADDADNIIQNAFVWVIPPSSPPPPASEISQDPPFFIDEIEDPPPGLAFSTYESIYSMEMSDTTVVVGSNFVVDSVDCVTDCDFHYVGYQLRFFDLELQEMGVIEGGVNKTLFSIEGLTISGNGRVCAVGIGNRASFDSSDPPPTGPADYQVDVYQFEQETGKWVPLGSSLYGSKPGDYFGESVELNYDGTFLAVGASADDSNGQLAGRVATFRLEQNEWIPFGPDLLGQRGSAFGTSVALLPSIGNNTSDQMVVGAPLANPNGVDTGEAFLYQIVGV